jgi:hypothetical protein
MREAGATSTELSYRGIVPAHRGYSWSHHSRSRATQRGRKAKAALVDDGPVQRGQQYKHYKDQSPVAPTRSNNLRPR